MAFVTVNFNGVVQSGTTGHTFTKTDSLGGNSENATLIIIISGLGTNQLEYTVTWAADPIAGDIITFSYTAGDYLDSENEPMADAGPLTLRNCLDPSSNVTVTNGWTGTANCGVVVVNGVTHNGGTVTHNGQPVTHNL